MADDWGRSAKPRTCPYNVHFDNGIMIVAVAENENEAGKIAREAVEQLTMLRGEGEECPDISAIYPGETEE